MIQSFTKYICITVVLMMTTTSVSHATFSFFKDKTHDTKITTIKKNLLPEYCPPTTPSVPHTPPVTPTVPQTPTTPQTPPTSVSEPFALLATLGAMSAFLYHRRHNKKI